MVQVFLRSIFRKRHFGLWVICALLISLAPLAGAGSKNSKTQAVSVPELELEGGRKLTFERSFWSEPEVRLKRGFWNKLIDIVAGAPDFHALISPYEVVEDSHGRIIVSDPGAAGIHIFDFGAQKYKFVARMRDENGLEAPQCLAVDSDDNIYVTDSQSGKIFVFEPGGKFQRVIGSLKGGEGYFKRPTGIAVDSAAGHIYVTDTLRDEIYMMDMQGSVLKKIGKRGTGDGEFNLPTELRLYGDNLAVVDALNFRVQVLNKNGEFQYAVGKNGDEVGAMFRPKGVAFDSEGNLYVVDGMWSAVQVFNREGQLLYYFGQLGNAPGAFQLPAGVKIDGQDRIYVVDSFNKRVQVFKYYGTGPAKESRP